jgi:hypothetical protein
MKGQDLLSWSNLEYRAEEEIEKGRLNVHVKYAFE